MYLWIRLLLIVVLIFLSPFAFAAQHFSEKPEVKLFIQQMVNEYHFDQTKLISLFNTVQPQPQVLANMKNPLEKETWKLYKRVFINDTYIISGADFRKKYHQTLVHAEKKYGVPASIIIATLGIETHFGAHAGSYRALDSLSNLAFTNQPRGVFFREELKQFLLLTREQGLDPFIVQGSYAGAIGAPQFMPSSYRRYAVSFSKKNHIDLIHNTQDAIVSVANYYEKHGWKGPHFVAVRASVKGNDYLKLQTAEGLPKVFASSRLAKYHITPERKIANGYKLKLITLDGPEGKEYWLVFPDFDVIKRYNASNLYAMAIYQLSQSILKHKQPSPLPLANCPLKEKAP